MLSDWTLEQPWQEIYFEAIVKIWDGVGGEGGRTEGEAGRRSFFKRREERRGWGKRVFGSDPQLEGKETRTLVRVCKQPSFPPLPLIFLATFKNL